MEAFDNVFWKALAGRQRAWTVGTGRVRRYAPGLPNLLAFSNVLEPALSEFREFCGRGERFFCNGWAGAVPEGWKVDLEAELALMVWNGGVPDQPAHGIRPLGPEHRAAAQALVELAQPGPFGERAFELGTYLGCFEEGTLVAMAGERLHAEGAREISAVSTHPDFRGRGLAGKLVGELVRRQIARGEMPFLHVLVSNTPARDLYRRMGFRELGISPVRAISAQA